MSDSCDSQCLSLPSRKNHFHSYAWRRPQNKKKSLVLALVFIETVQKKDAHMKKNVFVHTFFYSGSKNPFKLKGTKLSGHFVMT